MKAGEAADLGIFRFWLPKFAYFGYIWLVPSLSVLCSVRDSGALIAWFDISRREGIELIGAVRKRAWGHVEAKIFDTSDWKVFSAVWVELTSAANVCLYVSLTKRLSLATLSFLPLSEA